MNCYYILQHQDSIDWETRVYSNHTIDGRYYGCIDIVYHTWDAEDCKRGLIDHDWYDANILVIAFENLWILDTAKVVAWFAC